MKKFLLVTLMCACMHAYGTAPTPNNARSPHKLFKFFKAGKTKKVKVYGYDRARSVRRVRSIRGADYYSYANRRSYLKMMGRAINGDSNFR
jgi:hypothetical protein